MQKHQASGLIFVCLLAAPLAADDQEAFFETRIRPVLMGTCFTCHGGEKTASGLRVDSLQHLVEGGEYGSTVVPGSPAESLLLSAIRYEDDDLQMPPKGRLPERVVADFEKWISDGAVWPSSTTPAGPADGRHWAFQPLNDVHPPAATTHAHPIDRFLADAHRAQELQPVDQADRLTLIRRASYDLTGLPPTPAEAQDFLSDEQPGAFARVIDRLLVSPRYGERWARHWLDLVRYADTAGDDSDYPIPQAALYRDYVIDSFAADKPYDAFLREQIAGDLLARDASPQQFREQTIATGLLAQAKRFATGKHEDMHLIIEDTLHTIGQTVLGLTVRCARCHDHKYDPMTQEDYYALYGFFASTVYPHPGGESDRQPSDLIPLIGRQAFAEAEASFAAKYRSRIAELEREIREIESRTGDRQQQRQLTEPLRNELQEIRRQDPWQTTPLAYAVKEGSLVNARIQIGGNPRRQGQEVPRSVPSFLSSAGSFAVTSGQSGRLELADWLTRPGNPLTARVMVNRIWQHHFGKGIVASPSNFGLQGELPTHPELLDWLAAQFIESGWSIKEMHRLMMTSAAYQRAGTLDAGNADRDPANRYYWRFDRRRLDAESIRDSLLLAAGNLDFDRPGEHPFPPTESWRFSAHRQFKAVYPSNHRSIYLMVQRLHPHPFLSLFNGPTTTASVAVRDSSTLPLQALFMANSEFIHEQAEGLAGRLAELTTDERARVDCLYWLVYSRPATSVEIEGGINYLQQYQQILADESGVEPANSGSEAWASLSRTLFAANEFVYID